MDYGKLTLFSLVKKRLSWLGQRQEVLAQNIANADTPEYQPKDLKPFQFRELVKSETMQVNLNVTDQGHLAGRKRAIQDYATQEKRPYETAPAGNAVILEEQMAKVGETQINHRLTTDVYKRHLLMIKEAIGKRQ